jgi:hypothetical protein
MLHPSFSWVEEVETHLGSLLFEIAFFPQVQKAFHWGFWLPGVSGLDLTDRQPSKDGTPAFDWLGVSFGLTAPLFRFWSRAGYRPVVMSNTPNDQTGEMSIKMLLPVSVAWRKVMVWSPGKYGCGYLVVSTSLNGNIEHFVGSPHREAALERALPAITPLFGTSFYRRLATCFRTLGVWWWFVLGGKTWMFSNTSS